MLAKDEVGHERIGTTCEKAGRYQVSLMNGSAIVATADGFEDLIAKPREIAFELDQHRNGREVAGQRFVSVQKNLRIFLRQNVNGFQQALKISFLSKRSADIQHDEITDEHHTLPKHID